VESLEHLNINNSSISTHVNTAATINQKSLNIMDTQQPHYGNYFSKIFTYSKSLKLVLSIQFYSNQNYSIVFMRSIW